MQLTFLRNAVLSVAALAASIMLAQAQESPNVGYTSSSLTRSLVFNKGDFGSKFYRIPAITTLPDGTLVAVADKRIDRLQDLPGRIDVVARRSADGGVTWGPYITVAEHDSIGGYGDPAIVRDRRTGDLIVISTHGNGLWQKEPGHISVSRSRDGGLTWLPAVDINNQILTTDPAGKQPIKCCSAFASSGAAVQLASGRIMFVLVTRIDGVEHFPCYAVYSDDGGYNWKVAENAATLNGDESKVAQLTDGTLIMSSRNRYQGPRQFSYSMDNGRTWTAPEGIADLYDPACNGDFIHYTYGGRDLLLQSLPAGNWREDVTIYVSKDNGKTWPVKYQVLQGPSAYSAMTVMADGSIGVLTEEATHDADAGHHQGYRIWFTRIPIATILGE